MSDLVTRLAVWWTERQYKNDLERLEDREMTYKLMKRIIEKGLKKGDLDVEATMQKLDVFLMADRITPEEYQDLVELMNGGAE